MAKQINDITKTGPRTWRNLQQENEMQYNDDLVTGLSQLIAPTKSLYDIEEAMPQQVQTSLYNDETGDYWGNSMFDDNYATDESISHLTDIRAENQPWYAQAAAGITKGAVLAGTTFIDGTLGLLYGLGQGIYNTLDDDENTDFLSGIWDNPITQAMNSVNEYSEKLLPNYYTEAQQNGPWYSADNIFSANFLFDKLIKNAGFMVGAAYSGGLYTKGIQLGANLLGKVKTLASAAKGAAITEEAIQAGQKAMQAANATRHTKALVGSFFNAVAEGTVEAVSNSNDWVKAQTGRINEQAYTDQQNAYIEYISAGGEVDENGYPIPSDNPLYRTLQDKLSKIDEGYKASMQQIEADRHKVGNADLLMNIPILWAGDWMTFGKMYAGGWKAARNTNKTVTRATKQALADAKAAVEAGDKEALKNLQNIVAKAEKTGYQGLTDAEKLLVEEVSPHILERKTGAFLAGVKEPLKEGNEEMAQASAASAAGLYYQDDVDNIYNAKINPEAKQKTLSWLGSIWEGMGEHYGNIDAWEEGFIGALTGMLGSPTFGKKNNSTDQTYLGRSKWIGLTGGVYTQVRDYLRDRDQADRTAAHITKIMRDGKLVERFQHLTAQTYFDDVKNQAVIHDDKMTFKDAETAQIFEDIMYLKKADRLDLLKSALTGIEEIDEASIDDIIKQTESYVSPINDNINANVKERDKLVEQRDKLQIKLDEGHKQARTLSGVDNNLSGETINAFNQYVDINLKPIQDQIDSLNQQIDNYESRINDSKARLKSPYIKSDGTMMSKDEIKEELQERAKRVNDIIDNIADAQDEIDNATGQAFTDEQLTTLTWYKVMMRDWAKRSGEMGNNLKNFVRNAINDPAFKQSIETIDNLLNFNKEHQILSEEQAESYGGKILATKKYLKGAQSVMDILQKIASENPDYGVALAQMLANDKKIKVGEGENVEEVAVGQYLQDALKSIIDSNLRFTDDQKAPLFKDIEDLKRIGESYTKYNELLEEYLKNPEKIDKVHSEMTNRATINTNNRAAATISERFDWEAPVGTIARLLQDNKNDIESMGGFAKFMSTLTTDQKKKVQQAQKLIRAIDSVDSLIDDSDLSDNAKRVAHALVDDNVDEAEDMEALANAISKDLDEGAIEEMSNILDDDSIDERAKLKAIENMETQLHEFFDEALQKSAKAADEAERMAEADIERKAKAATKAEEEGIPESSVPKEGDMAVPNEDLTVPTEEEENTSNPVTPKEVQAQAKTAKMMDKPQDGKEGYANRPQLSEVYLHSINMITYLDYLKAHPENIPQGVDKDDYLRYIEAVHTYLKERGAFAYVNGVNEDNRLKVGDTIEFITDPELNTKAGVPVILMVSNGQIIGSMKTSLDFQIERKDGKTYAEIAAPQKVLYDALIEELTDKEIVDAQYLIDSFRNHASEQTSSLDYYLEDSKRGIDSTGPAVQARLAPLFKFALSIGLLDKKYKDIIDKAYKENKLPYATAKLLVTQLKEKGINTLLDAVELAQSQLNKIKETYTPKEKSFITTKVQSLKGGMIAYSDQENTVATIFEGKQPVIAINTESGLSTGNVEKDKSLRQPINSKPWQVYVMIPANNGNMIPALCYSVPIRSLSDNDWYIQQAVAALQKLASSLADLGSNKKAFTKWLNVKGFSFNFGTIADKKWVEENTDKGKATHVRITYHSTDAIHAPQYVTVKLENGGISEASALKIIKKLSKGLTTNIDLKRLSDQEYMNNMSRYLMTNIVKGQTHTVNDWFTYELTDIEKKAKNQNVQHRSTETQNSPVGPKKPETKVVVDGKEVVVNDGNVETTDGSQLTPEQQQQAKDIVIQSAETIDLSDTGNTNESNDKNYAFISQTQQKTDTSPKKRGVFGRSKRMETSVSEEPTATKDIREASIEKAKELFPNLNETGRIVVVEGLIHSIDNNGNPVEAYGLFKDGILYISDKSPAGTAFHEAFHYATDMLLTSNERDRMFSAAQIKYGNLDQLELEEKLAEAFRKFMNGYNDKSIKGTIRNIFRGLKHIILSIVGRENYLDNLFYSIYRGKLGQRNESISQSTKTMQTDTQQKIEEEKEPNDIRFMETPQSKFKRDLIRHKQKKYAYSNLDQETKDYLALRHTTEEEYSNLNVDQQEAFLVCLI